MRPAPILQADLTFWPPWRPDVSPGTSGLARHSVGPPGAPISFCVRPRNVGFGVSRVGRRHGVRRGRTHLFSRRAARSGLPGGVAKWEGPAPQTPHELVRFQPPPPIPVSALNGEHPLAITTSSSTSIMSQIPKTVPSSDLQQPSAADSGTVISLERQVRITAGALVVTGVVLGWFVHPGFYGLSAFIGAGLVFAGITDICGVCLLLAKLPWNKRRPA